MRNVLLGFLVLFAVSVVGIATACDSTNPQPGAEAEDPRIAALMALVGTEFDGNSGDRIRQILDLDPDESIWAITREPLDPDIAADLSPRCEVYDGATADEYADFLECRDEALGDDNCDAKTVFVLELNEDGETFDIVGIQVICQNDPKF